MEKLDADSVAARLEQQQEWSQSGDAIQRTFSFPDFLEAMAFVNRVAELAEQHQHHPDIMIRYNKVTLTLSTHDASGLTAKDFDLAEVVDGYVAST